ERQLKQLEANATTNPLTRWRGARVRRQRIETLIGRLGLSSNAEAVEKRRELLAKDHGEVAEIVERRGSARGARPMAPPLVDHDWVDQKISGMAAAAGVEAVEAVPGQA